MSHALANTVWARALVDELARAGVREVALSPGSRSTPLVLAFARDGRFRLRVHLDERSASFFALGVGKATGRPAAMVTTSGTAAANVFPAVVEAWASEAPLLVLTADRPPRLRGADANQTVDQVKLYGTYPRDFVDVAPPSLDASALRHLRAVAARAVASAAGPPAGPVHLNLPFDKPLEPVDVPDELLGELGEAASGRPNGAPFVNISAARPQPSAADLDELGGLLASPRGVIVAGPSPDPERLGRAVRTLAAQTGYPVLADPLSGARFGPAGGAHVVAAYDLFLREPTAVERLVPSLILRVGAAPTSAPLLRWATRHADAAQIVVDAGARWKDHDVTASRYVRADAADTLGALAERARRSVADEWALLWRSVERAALDALASAKGEPHEGSMWDAVIGSIDPNGALFISNSMAVRDLDAFGHPAEACTRVLGNRGVSGIDGVISTAFGVASQRSGPTVCVVGDVAFFHDQNGLLWSREGDASVVFVLVDNDGGGIFHALPVAEHEPYFTELFATPHGLDLGHAAEMHGLELRDVAVGGLQDALREALGAGGTCVLRVPSDRAANQRRHEEVAEAVAHAVREALQE